MTEKSFADRLFDPARRARNRLRARTAWLGAKGPAPAGPLPEALVLGDADRGAEPQMKRAPIENDRRPRLVSISEGDQRAVCSSPARQIR